MSEDKISGNAAIEAALRLDGDPENVRSYYEDWAANYDIDIADAEYSAPQIAAHLLQQYLEARRARLLDAGCGTGLVGIELGRLGYDRIDGFDLAEAMAQRAKASGGYRTVLGGIDIMRATETYAPASYDAVLSVGVFTLGHVAPRALCVLCELVRPGGLLLVSTRTHYYQQTDYRELSAELLESGRLTLLKSLLDAPYNKDGDAHYWVYRVSG